MSGSFVGRKVEYFNNSNNSEWQFRRKGEETASLGDLHTTSNNPQLQHIFGAGTPAVARVEGKTERSETPAEVKCLRRCIPKFQLAFNFKEMPEDSSSLVLTLLLVSIYKQLNAYPSQLISQKLSAREAIKNCGWDILLRGFPNFPIRKLREVVLEFVTMFQILLWLPEGS